MVWLQMGTTCNVVSIMYLLVTIILAIHTLSSEVIGPVNGKKTAAKNENDILKSVQLSTSP